MQIDWEQELAALLRQLSDVQHELLELLAEKRNALVASNTAALAEMQTRETAIVARLQQCQQERQRLLALATENGLPSDSVRKLVESLPADSHSNFKRQLKDTASRARLLQHHSLTNWVLIQRTLLHLSQMLEIIATGGRSKPTYGKGISAHSSGSLVDQAA